MATTTNYGWNTPDNTDAVANGALAIRTLGSAIDTTLATVTDKTPSGGVFRNGVPGANTAWTNLSHIHFIPFKVEANTTLASVAVNVADSASTTSYMGIYNADASTLLPSTRLVDLGSFSGSTTGIKSISTTQALTPGLYWLGVKPGINNTSYGLTGTTTAPNERYFSKAMTAANAFTDTAIAGMVYLQSSNGSVEATAGTFVSFLTTAPLFRVVTA